MEDLKKHRWTLTFDGGASPNPGIGSCAFKAVNELGEVFEDSWRMEGIRTNNEAEWDALATGLEMLIEHDKDTALVRIIGDSELIINQLSGAYKVRDKKLIPYYERVTSLRAHANFGMTYHHVTRNFNTEMDDACKAARGCHKVRASAR